MIFTNFNEVIPKIYDQQRSGSTKVYARYYVEYSDWEWLVFEHSKLQGLFYGFILPEKKFTYFTLEQLESIQRDYGVDVDLDFEFMCRDLKEFLDERAA